MLKNGFLSTTLCALILSGIGLRADTVTLKSGEKIEGKVEDLKENPEDTVEDLLAKIKELQARIIKKKLKGK